MTYNCNIFHNHENQNTALNSLAVIQCDPPKMQSKQDSNFSVFLKKFS